MKAEPDMKWAMQPRTVLELCSVRACHPEAEKDAALEERIAKVENAVKNGAVIAAPAAAQAAPASEKPAEAPAQAAPAPAASAPKTDVPDEYLAAIAAISEENPSMKGPLASMVFAGISGDTVTTEFPKKNLMHMKVLERKTPIIDAALTEKFGRPMHIAMRLEGTGATQTKTATPAKKVIEQSYDIFGRENIEIMD